MLRIRIRETYKLLRQAHKADSANQIPLWAALLFGAIIGMLSGLTGVGGGIFRTPLLLFIGWVGTRRVAGISAAFILVNSIAALAGNISSLGSLPPTIYALVPVAMIGGWIGGIWKQANRRRWF